MAPVGLAGAIVIALAVLGSWRSSRSSRPGRAGRRSTAARSQGASARAPLAARGSTAGSACRCPLALGVRDAFARRGRHPTAASLILSVVVVIAALWMEASFALEDAQAQAFLAEVESDPPPFAVGPSWDFFEDQSAERAQFRLIVYGLNAVLLLIAG